MLPSTHKSLLLPHTPQKPADTHILQTLSSSLRHFADVPILSWLPCTVYPYACFQIIRLPKDTSAACSLSSLHPSKVMHSVSLNQPTRSYPCLSVSRPLRQEGNLWLGEPNETTALSLKECEIEAESPAKPCKPSESRVPRQHSCSLSLNWLGCRLRGNAKIQLWTAPLWWWAYISTILHNFSSLLVRGKKTLIGNKHSLEIFFVDNFLNTHTHYLPDRQ